MQCAARMRAAALFDSGIGTLVRCRVEGMDGRAFGAPKGFRPRKRVKPGHDKESGHDRPRKRVLRRNRKPRRSMQNETARQAAHA